jgi:hypothetical protein
MLKRKRRARGAGLGYSQRVMCLAYGAASRWDSVGGAPMHRDTSFKLGYKIANRVGADGIMSHSIHLAEPSGITPGNKPNGHNWRAHLGRLALFFREMIMLPKLTTRVLFPLPAPAKYQSSALVLPKDVSGSLRNFCGTSTLLLSLQVRGGSGIVSTIFHLPHITRRSQRIRAT